MDRWIILYNNKTNDYKLIVDDRKKNDLYPVTKQGFWLSLSHKWDGDYTHRYYVDWTTFKNNNLQSKRISNFKSTIRSEIRNRRIKKLLENG